MPVKVFISHKNEDAVLAGQIAKYLGGNGLDVYLDVIDAQLSKSGPDLADYIRAQLAKCTQLLAVISPNTQTSWWVPWEIGVATEKERFLASYISGGAAVPEFLQKWPYLRSESDLATYVKESKQTEFLVEDRVQKGHRATARADGFREFHRVLKAALRQA